MFVTILWMVKMPVTPMLRRDMLENTISLYRILSTEIDRMDDSPVKELKSKLLDLMQDCIASDDSLLVAPNLGLLIKIIGDDIATAKLYETLYNNVDYIFDHITSGEGSPNDGQ